MKLQDLMEMANTKKKNKRDKNLDVDAQRNFVAKNARSKSGAGQHEDKVGKNASRNRQKRQWKKEENM